MQKRGFILCVSLRLALFVAFAGLVRADDQAYSVEASFTGGAGSTATNSDYSLISSWRQLTQTSLSSGGEYENSSGFLAATFEDTEVFRIVSFGFTTNAAPVFQITTPTKPSHSYVVQFADDHAVAFAWQSFANTNQMIGTYLETNTVSSAFTFADDFTPATSGGPSSSGVRFYRVIDSQPTSAP